MKTITFIDSIGRTILGEEVSVCDTSLKVKNPVMINVVQTQNGQLQVQLIPLFFSEFIQDSAKVEGSSWTYNRASVVLGEVEVDSRLLEQYTRILQSFSAPSQPQGGSGEPVIKLFDE
jgi:hypothetical protein